MTRKNIGEVINLHNSYKFQCVVFPHEQKWENILILITASLSTISNYSENNIKEVSKYVLDALLTFSYDSDNWINKITYGTKIFFNSKFDSS